MTEHLEMLLAAEVQRIATDLRRAAEPAGAERHERNEWLIAHPVADFVAPAFLRIEATRAKLQELRRG